ncbi:TatD family hydrolase [Mesoplasma seiffertii]|uniref:TatD family hydrolase n=1 Tax=Mesoplasma seiffertii TaxID=28224 RepID=UPI00047871C5|nr:TatD family hydrolase [Mesoplasma seiffertii]
MPSGIYDIHCHLNDSAYAEMEITSSEIVKEANRVGVDLINNIGFDIKSSKVAIIQAEKNKNVFAVVGIHPNEAHLFTEEAYEFLKDLAHADKVVAIGETGLDYNRSTKYIKQQKESFINQIKIAQELNLPIMLHIRDVKGSTNAYDDALEILKQHKVTSGVVHSFEGTWEIAQKFINQGISISLNGEVTKIAEVQRIAKNISLNYLMVESDAPYSAPVPFDKRINHSKYLPLTVQKIAEIRGTTSTEIAAATRDNAQELFKIKTKLVLE